MDQCKFDVSWVGRCRNTAVPDTEYCLDHLQDPEGKRWKGTCVTCGEQATHDCEDTFQFVCGAPLCDKPECTEKHRRR